MKSWMKYTIAGYVIYSLIYNLIRSRDEVTYIEPVPERTPREKLYYIIFGLFILFIVVAVYFFVIAPGGVKLAEIVDLTSW